MLKEKELLNYFEEIREKGKNADDYRYIWDLKDDIEQELPNLKDSDRLRYKAYEVLIELDKIEKKLK